MENFYFSFPQNCELLRRVKIFTNGIYISIIYVKVYFGRKENNTSIYSLFARKVYIQLYKAMIL